LSHEDRQQKQEKGKEFLNSIYFSLKKKCLGKA
jgi:hypothetical protein